MALDIPRITVKVEYNGDEATHYGSHFIDGIKFLADCEALIRRNKNLNTPVDVETTEIGKKNLSELLHRPQ